jgi:hypothetical protein
MQTEKVGYHLFLGREELKTKTNEAECRRITTKFTKAKWMEACEVYLAIARAVSAGNFPFCAADAWNCSPKYCGYYHRCRGALREGKPIVRGGPGSKPYASSR